MKFSAIAGNAHVKKKLVSTVDTGRISHAWLFEGSDGNGALAMAVAYGQYLCCTKKTDGDSCGTCPACIKYQKLAHPDLHFVFPVVSSPKLLKPVSDDYLTDWRSYLSESNYHDFDDWLHRLGSDNKQAGIFAQESQVIIKKLNYKAFEAEYKVLILWMPEKMNPSASNKLLKLIEEPPPKTIFILVSNSVESVLKTIQSRTQLVKIPKIDAESMFTALTETYNLSEDKTKELVRLSDGNFLRAKKILEDDSDAVSEYFTLFAEMMRHSFTMNVSELLAWTDKIAKLGRERQKIFIDYALRLIRENFMLTLVPEQKDSLVYLTEKEAVFAEKFHQYIHSKNISYLTNEFNLAHKHIERNGYEKLIFLDLALKTAQLLKVSSQ